MELCEINHIQVQYHRKFHFSLRVVFIHTVKYDLLALDIFPYC
jgi:hypothetical protein